MVSDDRRSTDDTIRDVDDQSSDEGVERFIRSELVAFNRLLHVHCHRLEAETVRIGRSYSLEPFIQLRKPKRSVLLLITSFVIIVSCNAAYIVWAPKLIYSISWK